MTALLGGDPASSAGQAPTVFFQNNSLNARLRAPQELILKKYVHLIASSTLFRIHTSHLFRGIVPTSVSSSKMFLGFRTTYNNFST